MVAVLLIPTAAAAAAVEDWSSLSVAEAADTSTLCLRSDVEDLECLTGISLDDRSVLILSDEGATFVLTS